jgi:3-phenylpropionate/trans-cinnamate dioxygenase ferredoxin reductase subunit
MVDSYDVVVVGAGHGGVSAVTTLLKEGFEGTVALLSDESTLPYERPPLSKGFLVGEEEIDAFLFRTAEYWDKSAADVILDTRIVAVDADAHEVRSAGGRVFRYGSLVWAAGGTARMLRAPGAELAGIHTVRTLDGVSRLRAELPDVRSAVVIGGGYIGLEATAALRKLGIEVTVLEALDRLLERVTSPVISDFFLRVHTDHGASIRFGTTVAGFAEGQDPGRVGGVILEDGEVIPADVVIVGIGLVPEVTELLHAGADVTNGVVVDQHCLTTLDDVYAIGDCANHANAFAGGARLRLESVQNAAEQGKIVAAHILGRAEPYEVVPWFWSNQYDVKMKMAGLMGAYDRLVVRGDPDAGEFTVVYFRDGALLALDCVNRPGDYMQGRALIESGARLDPDLVADASLSLKEVLSRSVAHAEG